VIYGGTLQSPEVETGDILGVQKLLSTDEMMNTLSKNNDNLLEITNGFKIISKKIVDGQGTVGKLLSDETLANDLNSTMITLKRASANMASLSANLSAYTSKLQSKGSLTNDLITDTVIFSKLRSTISQLQEVAATSEGVMNNLKTTSATLNNGVNNINEGLNNNKAPLGMLLHDEQTASYIKVTLKNLQMGTKKLDEDLEALQHNFLLRGFFRKKARNEKADSTEN
jgi:phospholipid/cholesterol/gamma-HCH transport system substrate-binding protein